RPVNVERVRVRFRLESLAEHDLEDVPGVDVFTRLLDRGLEGFPGEVGFELRRGDGALEIDVHQRQVRRGRMQLFDQFIDTCTGFVVLLPQAGRCYSRLAENRVRHDVHGL